MFFAGMLLHELLAFTNRRPSASLALIAACAAVILRIVPTDGSLGYTLKMLAVFIGFGLLCWSCLAQPGSWLGFGLSWTPLRWLGNISYSYYLAHSLALVPRFMAVNFLLPGTQSGVATGVLLLPAMFAVTLVPSLLLYLAIERPLSLVVDRRDRQRL